MELRLQQFIESVETLAEIRNLDTWNPIVFQIEHPVNATRYTIVGAKAEPSYLGIPINTTWVVLDPQSQYYRMALKLVDTNNPDLSTTLPDVVSEDGTLHFYWNLIRTYDDIFSVPQYYNNGGRGPKGDPGPAGPPGEVNYSVLLGNLATLTGTLEIKGPATINENNVAQYIVELTEPQILADGTITAPQTRQVVTPIMLTGIVPDGTVFDANNVLHVGEVPVDTQLSLTATYPSWAKNAIATASVTVLNVAAQVTGVALEGPTSLNNGTQTQYRVAVTWSDGTTTYPAADWALDSTNFGTISSNGLLDIPTGIASSGSVNVSATLTIQGVTYTPNATVVVTKQVVVPTVTNVAMTGPNSVDSGTTGQFGIVVTWSDNTTTTPSATWTLNSAAFGSIGADGLLTVPSTISSSGSVTVQASLTVAGQLYTPSKVVSIVKQVVIPTVTGVTILGASAMSSGTQSQYSLSVSWSNGTTTTPGADSWSLDSANFGTISASGMLNVPSTIAASGSVSVQAQVTINGNTYNPTKTVNVTKVAAPTVTGVAIVGSTAVNSGASTSYSLLASWSNGTTTVPTATSWSVTDSSLGSITAGGVFSVPSTIAASGTQTIQASCVVDGQTYNPSLSVAVTLVVASAMAPRYGTGPALPANWSTFVNGLTEYPALTPDGKYQCQIDVLGSSTYMYFAYPASHGYATFYDKLSQFFGGMGGAGNSGQGPSAASIAAYTDLPVTQNVTIDGQSVSYYIYRSDFANLGAAAGNSWEVTLTTP